LFKFIIPGTEGLLNQALLTGNLEYAVDLCMKACRWADALILASTGGEELIKKAQTRYFHVSPRAFHVLSDGPDLALLRSLTFMFCGITLEM
jgi:hypothetical protein